MIQFHLDQGCGLPPYHQLIRQIRHALRLGQLIEGDRLPTVKDLATQLTINQNTVLKAYRELEYDGVVEAQPGVGTFIRVTLADASFAAHGRLRQELHGWLRSARQAGLDDESVDALIATTIRAPLPNIAPRDALPSATTVPPAGAHAPAVALDLSWAEFDRALRRVAGEVSTGGAPDVVVGVLRGGMVPAVVLAHQLAVGDVRGFEVSGTLSDFPLAQKTPPLAGPMAGLDDLTGLDTVLVDAAAGSGATAEAATAVVSAAGPARLRRVVTAVNTASWTRPAPDDDPLHFFDHVGITCDGWIRFPWELDRR